MIVNRIAYFLSTVPILLDDWTLRIPSVAEMA